MNTGGVSADSLDNPWGLAVDSTGLYVTEFSNNRVLHFPGAGTTADRVYGQAGSFTTRLINNGGLGANSIQQPAGLAVDSSGVYIVDYGSSRVLHYPGASTTADRVYGEGGSFTANLQNNGGVTATSLNLPTGVTLDGSGVQHIADYLSTVGFSTFPGRAIYSGSGLWAGRGFYFQSL